MNNTSVVSDPVESQHAALIDAKGIVKRFGAHVVVHNVSLSCQPGEVVLVLGANGAGKSTILRIIAGLVRADRGTVQIPGGVRLSYAGHHTGLYSKLSVAANLALYASLAGVTESQRQDLVCKWRLEDVQHKPVAEVSRGAQSKAALVRALLADPQVLLLDEPSSNLDEGATELLRSILTERAAAGCVALVATHDLARLQSVATRVVVMERGVLIADSGQEHEPDAIDSIVARYRMSNR
jgi:ABC-type multidrug transport system ATPase subunit